MFAGYFTADGRPYVEGRLALPRLHVAGRVHFLLDTGSDTTILHPDDGIDLGCPFDALENPAEFIGVGGTLLYYMEPAVVTFGNGIAADEFAVAISIAKPHPAADGLDSLLGRDILNRLRMEYDFRRGRLELAPESGTLPV